MGLKLSGKYFRSMAMEYSAGECLHFHQWGTMAGALPFEEKLRNFFFHLGKEVFFECLMSTCQCFPEEVETGPFWRLGAATRETVDEKCMWEVQT